MTRYKALSLRTEDMGFIEPHLTNEWGAHDVCLVADVDELEAERDRLRDALGLWWASHRPVGWTESDHLKHPLVNVNSTRSTRLVMAYMSARAALPEDKDE